jgi:hypothetical protein
MRMPIPVWDNPAFKFIVRESYNSADALFSTASGAASAIVVHWLDLRLGGMLPADDLTRSLVAGLAVFVLIWAGILLTRAILWPFQKNGGLRVFLRTRLGPAMVPVILIAVGFASFILLSGTGFAWLLVQAARGPSVFSAGNESASRQSNQAQPDLSLFPTKARYTLRWDPKKAMNFDIQQDGKQLGFGQFLNPTLILHNSSETVAADVTLTWQAEISDCKPLTKLGHFARYDINFRDEHTLILSAGQNAQVPAFGYYPSAHGEGGVTFVTKDTEIGLPVGITPILGLFLVAKMPDELGARTEPFPIRITVAWNVPEFLVKIRGVNTKPSGIPDAPEVTCYLDVEIERLN